MDCSTPGFPVHHQLLEVAQIHVHWIGDVIQPSHPLSSPSSPAFNLAQHQGLFWVSFLHQVAKVLELQLQHQSFSEYSGLISFRIDWFDLLVVQGTLKSLLQHHSSKASILWCSAFFIVQLSHPYMTTGKTIALTRRTFFSKVMSLLFNILSRLVIVFLPMRKCLLISWLQQTPKQLVYSKLLMPAASPAVWPWMSHSAQNNIPAANPFQSWALFPALQPLTPDHACLHYSPSVSFILIAWAYLLIGGVWLVRPWVVTILCLPRSFCLSHFPAQKSLPRTDSSHSSEAISDLIPAWALIQRHQRDELPSWASVTSYFPFSFD